MFLAYAALLTPLVVAPLLFSRLRPALAASVTAVASVLLLPENIGFDTAGLPPLSKYNLPFLGIVLGALLFARGRLMSARLGRGPDLLIGVLMLASLATALANADPLVEQGVAGLELHDGVSLGITRVLLAGLPFVVGRALFRQPRDLYDLLAVISVAALLYTPLVLIEMRLSPQIHRLVYGYHPEWIGFSYRWGGYRPNVFFRSGLGLAIFMVLATIASTTLARARLRAFRVPMAISSAYLGAVLVLARSTAAVIYGAILVPIVAVLGHRWMSRVAVLMAIAVIAYPFWRLSPLFPEEPILSAMSTISEERAQSLEFRFDNEAQLLARALERPVFGWGPKMRWMVLERGGEEHSTADGYWIITVGISGLVGFGCVFGLLVWPVVRSWARLRRIRGVQQKTLVAGLSLMVAISALDMIPNGIFTNISYFLAGGLYGATTAPPRRSPRKRSGPVGRHGPARDTSPDRVESR